MRVLYDHQIWESQIYGGVSRYFWEMIRRMACFDDVSVTVFAGLFLNQYLSKNNKSFPAEMIKGFFLKDFAKTKRARWFINNQLLKSYIAGKDEKWDIYHPTNFDFKVIPNGSTLIVTVFDMITELFPQFYADSEERTLQKKRAINAANQIIAISLSTRNDLMNLFNVEPDRITVIPLAPSLSFDHNPYTRPESFPYLLYVGDRSPDYKNFAILIQAFDQVSANNPELHLVFFGGGRFTAKEMNRIRSLKFSENVKQTTGNDQLLSSYYKYAKALIYPSLYEGFGLPLLDAMNGKCPIIASNTSSVPEVVGDAGCLFNPNEAGSLISSISQVLEDDGFREGLILKGLHRVKNFDWDSTATKTLNLYKKALSK